MNWLLHLAATLVTSVSITSASDFSSYGDEYVRLMQKYHNETDTNNKQNHFAAARGVAMILLGIPSNAKLVICVHIDSLCKSLNQRGQKLGEESELLTGNISLKKKRESEYIAEIVKFLWATARILEAMSSDLSVLDKLMIKSPESIVSLAQEIVVMLRVLNSFLKDGNDLDSIIAIVTEFATSGLEGTYLLSLPISIAMNDHDNFNLNTIIEGTDFSDKSQCKFLNVR
ncbi:MAG: hypothetical protein LBL32_00540 [Holosporales bacterium]|jgi:hypothetical protein|nr:hypothetical protein [Holosporales bacterium]